VTPAAEAEFRAWCREFAAVGLVPARQGAELLAELDWCRRELAWVVEASGVVRHATPAECVGCGCLSLSAAECAAELAAERDRLRALVLALADRVADQSELLSRRAGLATTPPG
jgi:hypothetical protein